MANLNETPTWEAGIYQLEETDPVQGGANGIDNLQAKQLANRTAYLKQLAEDIGTGKLDTAALANQAEAEEGVLNSKWMSPLRVAQAIAVALGTFAASVTTALAGKAALASAQVFTKGNVAQEKALPATVGTITLDLADGNNFGGTLTGNVTLANPSNMQAGQSGILRIVNDATPRTIAYGSFWKSPSGAMPALTNVAGAVDVFGYYVEGASRITLVMQADVK